MATTVGRPLDIARRIIAEGALSAQEVQGDNEAWELATDVPDAPGASLRDKAIAVIAHESARERWKAKAS